MKRDYFISLDYWLPVPKGQECKVDRNVSTIVDADLGSTNLPEVCKSLVERVEPTLKGKDYRYKVIAFNNINI